LFFHTSTSTEIDTVFSSFFAGAIEALFIMGDGFFVSRSAQIAALTNRQRIPASFATGPMVEAGLLMGYSGDIIEALHQVGIIRAGFSAAPSRPTFRPCKRPNSHLSST
jgi:putative ABC transport system substrate-binding protein